jgi:acetylornithine/succinyldiaminopimelate/putrescine aminotransferase
LEPIQAEGGIIVPQNDYLKKVRQRCDATGTLLILDEIQTGFGRTGQLFAHQKYGIAPDILLIAKGMGGGMPIGAFVANRDLMSHFTKKPSLGHITTFGGHPVCVAAALATLKFLLSTDLIAKIYEKEAQLKSLLVHPLIKEVRSSGLMMAVELHQAALLPQVIDTCRDRGLLTDYFLFNSASFRIAPPLIISHEEIILGTGIILKVLDDLQSQMQ